MTDKMTRLETLEVILLYLCYIAGMGLILFGALSGNHYGYFFVIIGALLLVIMIIHSCRREAQLNENAVTHNP
jgi:hypothetical protein